MLLCFAGSGTAAHADVFDSAAETGHLMSFEMGQADKDIGIHNGTADFGFFYVFAALYGYIDIIGAL